MKLWEINQDGLQEIGESKLETEKQLEDWIEKEISILGLNILVIGRQIITAFGGRIDLLAIDDQGDIVIIELKKDKTPRDVIAQILDYASWIRKLNYNEISLIAMNYLQKDLPLAFSEFFNLTIPENINSNHKMIIVASEFDESSERILNYLADEYQVNINAIFFNTFNNNGNKILGRAWLMDPEEVQIKAEARKQAPWQGYWFVNVGEGSHRNWEDNIKYNYIGAGQDIKYSKPLKKLQVDDEIFAYMKGYGYVGYGKVIDISKPIKDFYINDKGDKLLDAEDVIAPKIWENKDDPNKSEYAVKISWIKSFKRDEAKFFKGAFANQNIVCKLRHLETLDYLKKEFGVKNI